MELYMFGIFTGMIITLIIFAGGVIYADILDKRTSDRYSYDNNATNMADNSNKDLDRSDKREDVNVNR